MTTQWYDVQIEIKEFKRPIKYVHYYFSVVNNKITGFYNYNYIGYNFLAPKTLPYPIGNYPNYSPPADNIFQNMQFSTNGVNFSDTDLQAYMAVDIGYTWWPYYNLYNDSSGFVLLQYCTRYDNNMGFDYSESMFTQYINITPISEPPPIPPPQWWYDVEISINQGIKPAILLHYYLLSN